MAKSTFLTVEAISKEYVAESGDVVVALQDLSLDVDVGEFLTVVGPSGCGKTTLLELVSGLQEPTGGQVLLNGRRVSPGHVPVGMVFQEDSVFPWRRVRGNVEFCLEVRGVRKEARRRRGSEMIELVGLKGFEDAFPAELSGGMRQRVAIARALAMDPELLLLDEPFGALDELTRLSLGLELERIWLATRKTILLITHSINEALLLSDRILVFSRRPGRIIANIAVPFNRPRSTTTLSDPRFGELAGEIWRRLSEPMVK